MGREMKPMDSCPNCKSALRTFVNKRSTMPQDNSNKIRTYTETFCSNCGHCIDKKIVDTQNGKPIEVK